MPVLQPLEDGIKKLGLSLEKPQIERLQKFVFLLQKWNKSFNLTAIDDEAHIISKHILDSLSALPYLKGNTIIDVGTGAGLPGLPLAISCTEKKFLLLDASAKKINFVQQAIIELGLNNVQVLHQRIEKYSPATKFDTVISRAFASGTKLLSALDHLYTDGQVLVMLGKQNSLLDIPRRYNLEAVHPIEVPALNANRHIAIIRKLDEDL